jgi:hypothetical protein
VARRAVAVPVGLPVGLPVRSAVGPGVRVGVGKAVGRGVVVGPAVGGVVPGSSVGDEAALPATLVGAADGVAEVRSDPQPPVAAAVSTRRMTVVRRRPGLPRLALTLLPHGDVSHDRWGAGAVPPPTATASPV